MKQFLKQLFSDSNSQCKNSGIKFQSSTKIATKNKEHSAIYQESKLLQKSNERNETFCQEPKSNRHNRHFSLSRNDLVPINRFTTQRKRFHPWQRAHSSATPRIQSRGPHFIGSELSCGTCTSRVVPAKQSIRQREQHRISRPRRRINRYRRSGSSEPKVKTSLVRYSRSRSLIRATAARANQFF